MKTYLVVALSLLVLSAPALGDGSGSTFLSQKEAKQAISKRAAKSSFPGDYYQTYGCWRINRRVVKCRVDFSDDEGYLCGAIYRAKIYLYDLDTLYTRVVWDSC